MRKLAVLAGMLVVIFLAIGCGETEYMVLEVEKEVEVEVEVLPPLLPPQLLQAWAEDSQVYISWLPSQDPTVMGYVIYRSTSELEGYEEVAEIDGWDVVSYVDTGLQNGITYYYGISSFDNEGYESEQMNPEVVWATARPEGEAKLSIGDNGFGFGIGSGWFYLQNEDNTLFLETYLNVVIQDFGYTDSLYDIGVSPIKGFISDGMRVINGHTYIFRMSLEGGGRYYSKIRVSDVGEKNITFEWAVQLQPNNPELAPRKRQTEPLVKQWGAIKSKGGESSI